MREAIARFLPFSFFTLWLTLTLGTLTLAQGLPRGRAAELGFSPQRLARIDAVVREHVDQKKIAGSVTLVARHGKIAQLGVYGMADREAGRPMQADTIFRLASMTKPVTSVAIIMLYEEGRLMLTDPVSSTSRSSRRSRFSRLRIPTRQNRSRPGDRSQFTTC